MNSGAFVGRIHGDFLKFELFLCDSRSYFMDSGKFLQQHININEL